MSTANVRNYVDILDEVAKKLLDFLRACDSIVPWFKRIRVVMESLTECSQKLNAMMNRNHDFGQIGIDGLKNYESFMQLLRLTVVFDIGLKLGMTQCSAPTYLNSLDRICENLRTWNFNPSNHQVLNELKTLAIEYGIMDEDNYDGSKAKTEDFLKLLNNVEQKLSQIENLEEPLGFVSIMEMKKFISKMMTIQPKAIYELPRESILQEIASLLTRTVTLANNISFKTESNSAIVYISQHRLLSKRKFERCGLFEVFPSNSFEQLAPHLLHFKTRNWLLGKIETWLVTTDKPFYYVVGSEGVGKSCILSAFCKLYDQYIINVHVFDSRYPSGVCQLIKSIASSLMHNFPEYLCLMDDLIPESQPAKCPHNANWQELYQFLLKNPFTLLYGNYKKFPKRKLVVVEGLNECKKSEWGDLAKFMDLFRKDFSYWLCMLVTCRTENMNAFPYLYERDQEYTVHVDGVNLDSKTWTGLHLTDLEMFTTSCFCDVIARRISPQELTHGDNFRGFNKSLDNFMKHSAGKFSYAQHLLRLFDESMVELHGQFHKSVIDAFERFTAQIGRDKMDENLKVFSKVFYNYRLNEGNPVQPPPEIFLIMAGKGAILQ